MNDHIELLRLHDAGLLYCLDDQASKCRKLFRHIDDNIIILLAQYYQEWGTPPVPHYQQFAEILLSEYHYRHPEAA